MKNKHGKRFLAYVWPIYHSGYITTVCNKGHIPTSTPPVQGEPSGNGATGHSQPTGNPMEHVDVTCISFYILEQHHVTIKVIVKKSARGIHLQVSLHSRVFVKALT